MASIQRRCPTCAVAAPTGRTCPRCGANTFTYRVRYVDPDGHEKSRSFKRKADADDFAASTEHAVRSGAYIDPAAGQRTVQDYLEDWRHQQAHHRPKTAASTTTRFRTMVYPLLGHKRLATIKPSTIRTWQKQLLELGYAASTITGCRGQLAGAFRDAVHDRLLPASPFDGVKTLDVERDKITPRTIAQVRAAETVLLSSRRTARYAAVIPVDAGTGLRWGELFGLTVDRINFLRRELTVDRQLTDRAGPLPVFGPPKSKAGVRTIPLPRMVVDALAAYLARHPARPGAGWLEEPGGRRPIQHAGLVFTTGRGTPLTRTVWNRAWHPARDAMGLAPGEGLHHLRHFYASLLIADGRSIKEVQERLGHATAQETLDTYGHLWPGSDDGTRDAIDRAFNDESGAARKDDAANDE